MVLSVALCAVDPVFIHLGTALGDGNGVSYLIRRFHLPKNWYPAVCVCKALQWLFLWYVVVYSFVALAFGLSFKGC